MIYSNCPFSITPYDQSQKVKTPQLISVNYTNQDFWSMKTRLVNFIKERFGSNFTDFVESDLAVMLIENWAFISDTLSFKIDQIANEIFIDTVSELDNAFRLAMLVGFQPTPPIGSMAMFSASTSLVLDTDLVITTPLSINVTSNGGSTTYELFPADANNNPIFTDDIVISTGSTMNSSIVGIQGMTYTQAAQGTGAIGQSVQLSNGPVLWQSISVQIDGKTWQEVPYFTDSQPLQEFRVAYDAKYNAFVIFGNNVSGMIPSNGSDIQISYRVGGGTIGNIITGAIDYQTNFPLPGFDYMVSVTFTNYTPGQNGYPGDALGDIKRKLPIYLNQQNRAVTGSDYQGFAESFSTPYQGQIGKAIAVLRNYGCAANIIDLYVLAEVNQNTLTIASNELKVQLSEAIDNVKMITDNVCVKDGEIIEVDV